MKNPKPARSDDRKTPSKSNANRKDKDPKRVYDSNRPESDGEDFNPGQTPRARPESTGEDF